MTKKLRISVLDWKFGLSRNKYNTSSWSKLIFYVLGAIIELLPIHYCWEHGILVWIVKESYVNFLIL